MFDFQKFCDNHLIETAPENDRHARNGWINVQCPFCKHPSHYHLGYNTSFGYFRCWRCGKHRISDTVKKLLRCSAAQAKHEVTQYQNDNVTTTARRRTEERSDKCELPCGTIHIEHSKLDKAFVYLTKDRGFNPGIIEQYNLQRTHSVGPCKSRIIVPYYMNDRLVTWQARDFTDKQEPPYLACPKKDAVFDVKETLYAIDKAREFDTVIVVEGIMDAMNMGPGAIATSGTSWTMEQVLLLAEWQRRVILFDADDPESLKHAESLQITVDGIAGESDILLMDNFDGDPGDLDLDTVNEIRDMYGFYPLDW